MAKKRPICYSVEREYLGKFTAEELISHIIQAHIKKVPASAGTEVVLYQKDEKPRP